MCTEREEADCEADRYLRSVLEGTDVSLGSAFKKASKQVLGSKINKEIKRTGRNVAPVVAPILTAAGAVIGGAAGAQVGAQIGGVLGKALSGKSLKEDDPGETLNSFLARLEAEAQASDPYFVDGSVPAGVTPAVGVDDVPVKVTEPPTEETITWVLECTEIEEQG